MAGFAPQHLTALLAPLKHVSNCWIAFSGGLDSSVLLSAAATVREHLPGALYAIHLDHGLHPDACEWAAHCQSQCDLLAVPFTVRRLHLRPLPGESIEAVAREARYRAFSSLLAPGDLLLTAHNRDDQAETLLLALLRGSGAQGLAAMPFAAPLGTGRLVRPLLDVTRESLVAYARSRGLAWIEDPSNRETAMDRNYLRLRVLPLVRARWPAFATTLSRSASHCAEAAQLTDRLAAQTLAGLDGERPGTIGIPALLRIDRPLQKAALRLWLRRRDFALPDTRQIDRILDEVLPARPDANPLVAWSGCEIRRYRQDLFALPPLPDPPLATLEIDWQVGGDVAAMLGLPKGLGRLEWHAASDRVDPTDGQASELGQQSLIVRFGLTGQDCQPLRADHRRPLKKVFQEAGIPVWLRPYVPLVFKGASLIAVAGVCRCRSPDSATDPLGEFRWVGHPWEEFGLLMQERRRV